MSIGFFLLFCAMFAWPGFRRFVLTIVGIIIWIIIICAGLGLVAVALGA